MSAKLSAALRDSGTRFRIFPQPRYLKAFSKPETIHVSVPPDKILAGPADERMYVTDAIHKQPYAQSDRPPYRGEVNAPVKPKKGHFDHLDPDSREFLCASMYATVRFVLDIWEDYFGRRIDWHFDLDFERLELIPLVEWNNAQAGYGFMEFGYARAAYGGIDFTKPHCQNFDVLAHEFGHCLIYATVGSPNNSNDLAVDYAGMQESAGDLIALIASLHFDSVVTHLLAHTHGNLFSYNELSRVGELSESKQVRIAFNYLRMADVNDEPHLRSLPFTGAVFDTLVEIFQQNLIEANLISEELGKRSDNSTTGQADHEKIAAAFKEAYLGQEEAFKQALIAARDSVGQLLATTWSNLSPHFLTYHDYARSLLRADQSLNDGRHKAILRDCFAWRGLQAAADSRMYSLYRLEDCDPQRDTPGPTDPEAPVKDNSTKAKKPGKKAGKGKTNR
ncbi:gluzincin family metallopeptidase [Methylomarinum vadi]|uniref:M36 family metallopeptidase n=1 Tax=Methylomarinum vadi TaxID=438855 RepID=UPI001267B2C5|nr:M36 family metallopeptidase [Methylomarinum vadi]